MGAAFVAGSRPRGRGRGARRLCGRTSEARGPARGAWLAASRGGRAAGQPTDAGPGRSMGVLTAVAHGLVRGADRMSKWTSKRGPRTFNKSRGTKSTGVHAGGKFVQIKEKVPEFVVPDLTGFKLKPYVNYRAPAGVETPMTAKALFLEAVAPAIEKDFKEGTFDPHNLEKYGFEPTQEGKLFQLYPKNFPR